MVKTQVRWEQMDKSKLPLSDAVEHYLIACQTEGKSPQTLTGYREKLKRYLNDAGGTVGDFAIENVRAHIAQLQRTPRWGGQRGAAGGLKPLAPESVLDHVRILKGFATWLFEEQYTSENVLQRVQRPKVPSNIIEILDDDEVRRVLNSVDPNTTQGVRDLTILTLFLDTGLRLSELVGLRTADVRLEERWLKVMGKGSKERIVPFGARTQKVLTRYLTFFRHEEREGEEGCLLRTADDRPITANTVKLAVQRVRDRTGIRRLHPHLLRHTFATQYLMAGGDVFTLQSILGHTTLEMTRRYVTLANSHVSMQHQRFSPLDRLAASPKPGLKDVKSFGIPAAPRSRTAPRW